MNIKMHREATICITGPGKISIPITDLLIDESIGFVLENKKDDSSHLHYELIQGPAISGSMTLKMENNEKFNDMMKSFFPGHYCLICNRNINKTYHTDLKNNLCFRDSLPEKYQPLKELNKDKPNEKNNTRKQPWQRKNTR